MTDENENLEFWESAFVEKPEICVCGGGAHN